MQQRLFALGLWALAAVCAAPALAQSRGLPQDARAAIAAMGATLNPEIIKRTIAIMTPLVAPVAPEIAVKRDVSYGPDPLQKLDIYRGPAAGRLPVVVYVHGGGFVGGDMNAYGPIYGNIPAYFAGHGMVGVNLDYRLAPKATWPAGAEDVGSAVAWLKTHAGEIGADPQRIFLIGHSAGGAHVASYVFDASLAPKEGSGIAGAILMSGVYVADLGPRDKLYYGEDASLYAQRAPLAHVAENKLPVLLITAEFDPPEIGEQTLALASRLCASTLKCPPIAWISGHNHISEGASLNTGDERVGRRILSFVAGVK